MSIGSDSIKRTLTNLAAGRIAPDSTDAINGSQMFSIAKKLQDDKANKSQAYTFTIQNRASSLNNNQGNADRWTLAADDSLSFGATTALSVTTDGAGKIVYDDSGENSRNTLGSTLTISGGQTDRSQLADKPNIGVISDGKGKLSVKLAKKIDLTKEGSLTIGDTIINHGGLTIKNGPSITKSGINAGGQRITNVAPGINGSDAVNMDQLNQASNQANAGIASASAIANLPQVHLSGKSAVAVAAANYRGESAYAIGYSRISDNGTWAIRLSSSGNTQKDFVIGGGAGYIW